MAMRMRWSNARGIARFRKSRATLDAPGCQHRVTTSSVSPQRLPGQQKNKQQSTNDSKKVAKLMAMVMRRYVTAHIAQWRRFRAFQNATKCHHWASIAANNDKWDIPMRQFCSLLEVDVAGDGAISTWQGESSMGVSYIKLTRRTWPMSLNTRRGGIT
jgi:hypothetical protein